MFIQGYGIGFTRDPRVASHPDPNTRSSVTFRPLHTHIESFNLPHLGGKLTEMTYLWTRRHMDARNWDTALLCIFQYHIHNIAFFENFWVKNFFGHFWTLLNWTRILNINTKKWKKNFFRYPLPNILNFFENFGSKNFFWVILVFNELSSNFEY